MSLLQLFELPQYSVKLMKSIRKTLQMPFELVGLLVGKLMKNIPVKYQVTFGLVGLLVCIMSLSGAIGILPNERAAVMRGRGDLCSAIAINGSILINKRDFRTLENLLNAIVERDDDVISAAIRSSTGKIRVATDSHAKLWQTEVEQPLETHMHVDLTVGSRQWGQLEICFNPVASQSPIAKWISPVALYTALVAVLCLVAFTVFLSKVLTQLDPSKAVPKRVEDALNTLTEGLILTDSKGRIRLANDAFAKWMRCKSKNLIGVRPVEFEWTQLDASCNTDGSSMPWDEAIKTGSAVAGTLLQLPDENGKTMTLIANASPIIGAKGDYVGVLTSFEDVTDLEEHKVELSKAKESADNANRAKSDFLARMSHEIRTPMNAILGYAEVLRENLEEDPAIREKHLATIHNSGEHLLELINDILDLSKIESGQMELERAPVSIFQLMSDIESVLKIKAQQKGVYLRCEYNGPLPKVIQADAVRLRQTIINLVGNAIKFTEKGGITIRPEIHQRSDASLLRISIADTGIGMSREAMERVFNPFSQADTSITRRFGGTGLGLSICKELAEKMGGTITVQSEEGVGSIFTLTIDAGDISAVEMIRESDSASHESVRTQLESVAFDLPSMHVLIVDDSETNRHLVSVYLKKENITFDVAANGQEAVEKVNAFEFDVVLMDMHMPVMDGFQATRMLREQGHKLPIIALTANAMAKDEIECRQAGCSGFLTKPISRQRLRAELATAVDADTAAERLTQGEESLIVSGVRTKSLSAAEPTGIEAWNNVNDNAPIVSSLPMDDEDFVYVARLFVDGLAVKTRQMVEALMRKDFEKLYELGHWLKGASGSAGYNEFLDVALSLESAAKSHNVSSCQEKIGVICQLANRTHVDSQLPELELMPD